MVKAKAKEKPIPPKIHCAYDELVSIEKLVPHPKNRNQHSEEQIERLASILEYQGIRKPCVVSKRSGFMTTWHGRLLAAKYAKWTHVPVNYQDYDSEEQEYADLVADNAIAEWATLDLASINKDLPALGPELDIEMLGIKDFVLEPMDKFKGDEDAVPEVPKEPTTRMGDLYLLGNHRLLCGDSTDKVQVERLMNGEKADMVFTDPPYGMNLNTDWSNGVRAKDAMSYLNSGNPIPKAYSKVIGDSVDFDPTYVLNMFEEVKEIFLWGADYYSDKVSNRNNGSWIVWDKRCDESADKAFGANFELCWSKAKHKREIARIRSGIFGVKDDSKTRVYPTQKPTVLAEWFFDRWGKDAKNIWDGYLGSGSTLIACEKTNRRCFGLEIDPLYCDVIVERWEKYTGKKATKVN